MLEVIEDLSHIHSRKETVRERYISSSTHTRGRQKTNKEAENELGGKKSDPKHVE